MKASSLIDVISSLFEQKVPTFLWGAPDIDEILESGKGEYSNDVDVLYALSVGLVSGVLKDTTDEKIDNLLNYTLDLKSEFAVMIVQDLQRNGVTMEHSEVFKKWVDKFSYLLL